MIIHDISMTIAEHMQVWKDAPDKRPSIFNVRHHSQGTPHESGLRMNVHTGTHVDAPLHMIEDGDTIDMLPLGRLIGPARVLDLSDVQGSIGQEHLSPYGIRQGERILLKTRNSWDERFNATFVFVNESGASFLAEAGVGLVGIDSLGIERAQSGYPTHRTLMANDVIIVEGLRLQAVPPGNYTLIAAPLKLTGIDGAPARVLLIEGEL